MKRKTRKQVEDFYEKYRDLLYFFINTYFPESDIEQKTQLLSEIWKDVVLRSREIGTLKNERQERCWLLAICMERMITDSRGSTS